jgi:hypothetical protein
MKMRTSVILCGLAGLLMAASCARQEPFAPEPPVPAVLMEQEAFDLAGAYMDQQQYEWGELRRLEARDWGYIFFYESPYAWDAVPPKTSHIVAVHHDGTVREPLRDNDRAQEQRQAN